MVNEVIVDLKRGKGKKQTFLSAHMNHTYIIFIKRLRVNTIAICKRRNGGAERLGKLSKIPRSENGRSNQDLNPGLFGSKEHAYLVNYTEKHRSR